MSSKDEKSQAAAERIKAQALSQAKGLSRAQAERAATAAARNVNAYGQKEEGPSRWQERKEAKRQMYLMSTEKAVTLGVRKDLKASSSMSAAGSSAAQCQRCLQPGHWTYECKNQPVYISRPSRTQQLKNPKLRLRPSSPIEPQIDSLPENGQKREKSGKSKEKRSKRSKRRHRSGTDSESESSEASVFESDSGSSSATESGSSSASSSSESSSDSEDRRRRRRTRKQKRTRRRRDSSSDSSDSESDSESDSDDSDNRKNSRRHRRRR